jgi:hypothetical protein
MDDALRNRQRITALASALKDYTGKPEGPSGRKLYYDAVSAKFPAHKVGDIWHFYADDLPTIAAAYGLAPQAAAPGPKVRRPQAATNAAA